MDTENLNLAQPAEPQAPVRPEAPALVPAGFNERFLAYLIDTAPFFFGAQFAYSLLLKGGAVKYSSLGELKWRLLWAAAFIFYETIFSSGGRATLGKRLLGIQVVHVDGENYLSIPGAFVRGLAYFVSFLLLSAGYLMALVTRNNRALHDYIAQSRVISVRPRSELAGALVIALSWSIMAGLLFTWLRPVLTRPSPEDRELILAARTTVNKIATLEEIHRQMYGGYTDEMKRLAFLTRNVEAVRREVARTLERDTLSIASNGRVYIITARARDRRHTEVRRESAQKQ